MLTRKSALLLCALLGLAPPHVAAAQDRPAMTPWGEPRLQRAQFMEPSFDGPPPFEGDGYGPPPGYGQGPGYDGPTSGYGGGRAYGGASGEDEDRGYRTRRSRSRVSHVTYHGFRIDLSKGAGSRNLTREVAAIEHQIDLVDSVGLSLSDLGTFRRYPISVSAGTRGNGHYSGGSRVTMGAFSASDRRPVLLHEYMHVYHHARLPGGFGNPDIRAFYQEALSRGLYPAGSYMMKNPGEFFAMTASCYLYGSVARPPNTREEIRTRQPDYYAYLARLFGPPHGMHMAGTTLPRHGAPAERYGEGAPY